MQKKMQKMKKMQTKTQTMIQTLYIKNNLKHYKHCKDFVTILSVNN